MGNINQALSDFRLGDVIRNKILIALVTVRMQIPRVKFLWRMDMPLCCKDEKRILSTLRNRFPMRHRGTQIYGQSQSNNLYTAIS